MASSWKKNSQSPTSEEAIGQMFDRIAFRYDLLNSILSLGQDSRWRRALIKALRISEGGKLLDLATGTGAILRASLPLGHLERYGCDISPKMLDHAKDLTKHNVNLAVMSATQLTYEHPFDAITMAFGLRNVVDKRKALQEIFRLLKPGGQFLCLEFFVPEHTWLQKCLTFYFYKVVPFLGGLLSDQKAYAYLPQSVGAFWSYLEFIKVLKETGFEARCVKSMNASSVRLVEAIKPMPLRAPFQ